jgi:hypothetical protein
MFLEAILTQKPTKEFMGQPTLILVLYDWLGLFFFTKNANATVMLYRKRATKLTLQLST